MTSKRSSVIDLVQGLDYTVIDSSQYQSSPVPNTGSQSQSQSHHTPPASKPLLPDSHPIYGVVNLALLAVAFYLIWANL